MLLISVSRLALIGVAMFSLIDATASRNNGKAETAVKDAEKSTPLEKDSNSVFSKAESQEERGGGGGGGEKKSQLLLLDTLLSRPKRSIYGIRQNQQG
jgi:hypothetical protein